MVQITPGHGRYTSRSNSKVVNQTDEFGKTEVVEKSRALERAWDIFDEELANDGSYDPARCLQAVHAHILLDHPLPAGLKNWFLDGLEKHRGLEGKKTLDEIFGIAGKESKRHIFNSSSLQNSKIIKQATELLCITNLPNIDAANLVCWRNQVLKPDPNTVTRSLRIKKERVSILEEKQSDEFAYQEIHLSRLEPYLRAREKYGATGLELEYKRLIAVYDFIKSKDKDEYKKLASTLPPEDFLPDVKKIKR